MKTSLKRWVGRVPDLSDVLSRFPVAAAVMAIVTLIFIFIKDLPNQEQFGRMMMGLIIGGYAAMMITVAREAAGKSRLIFIQIAIATLLAVVFWFSESLRINLPMAMGATLALLGNAVLWRKPRNDLHVWDFTHKIWTGAGFAALGSVIFLIGILAIQEALKSLFGINIRSLTERLLLPIGLALLAPLYWLGTVPAVDEPYEELYDNPGFVSKAVGFLGTWLLSPLTLIYAAILIAYALKIIIAGSLPKGEIAQLTTPFLLIGTLTWLVLEPPFIQKHALARLFRRLWFPISIPATIMLAIAVAVRVKEYGLTEERVALILVVLWSFLLGLWLIFGPKAKRDIRLIPGLGAGLLVAGALTSGWLSIASQTSRLETQLADIKATDKPDYKTRQQAKSTLNYLWHYNAENNVRLSVKHAGYRVADGSTLDSIYEAVDLKDVDLPSRYGMAGDFRNYNGDGDSVDIRGFDKLYGPVYVGFGIYGDRTVKKVGSVEIRLVKGDLILFDAQTEIGRFDIAKWARELPASGKTILLSDSNVVIYEQGDRKIALNILSLSVKDGDDIEAKRNSNARFNILTAGF